MRGKKVAFWAVVISAALITAGLILSCGDDGNGDTAVNCQDVCEKLEECDMMPGEGDVEDCEEACEEELAGANEGLVEAFQCISDTDCRDIFGSCFCQPACEKLDYCGMPEGSMAECVAECEDEAPMEILMCILTISSCQYIWSFCFI